MTEIFISLFMLMGGIGVFITGMKLMGDGLEQGAGKSIQKWFGKISGSRMAGFGIGVGVTGIIQSSSATTVMIVGFVNAGIMTLFQAVSIIIGANVGTTVTGLIAALSSFKILTYALETTAFFGTFIVLFSKKEKLLTIGKTLSGLGLIFIGLEVMGGAFKNGEAVNQAIKSLFGTISFPLLLVLFGAVFTGIIQSSSAFVGVILAMVGGGVIPVEYALFTVLGANIGTCVTALIASIGTSVNARRAAVAHLLFNVGGTVVFVALLWIFQTKVVELLSVIPSAQFQIAIFHTVFNVVTAVLMLPFVKNLVSLVERIIPERKKEEAKKDKLTYLDDRILHTPSVAVAQLKREVKRMAELAKKNFKIGVESILKNDVSKKDELLKDEAKINFINKGIAAFLIKLSSVSTAKSEEIFFGSLHHVISDIERIGDYAQNFIEETEEIRQSKIVFSDEAIAEIQSMYEIILNMYDAAVDILMTENVEKLHEIAETEDKVDEMKKSFGKNHIRRLNLGSCSVDSGAYFYAVISGLERIADHLTNIAFSVRSPSGSVREAMDAVAKELNRHKPHTKKA